MGMRAVTGDEHAPDVAVKDALAAGRAAPELDPLMPNLVLEDEDSKVPPLWLPDPVPEIDEVVKCGVLNPRLDTDAEKPVAACLERTQTCAVSHCSRNRAQQAEPQVLTLMSVGPEPAQCIPQQSHQTNALLEQEEFEAALTLLESCSQGEMAASADTVPARDSCGRSEHGLSMMADVRHTGRHSATSQVKEGSLAEGLGKGRGLGTKGSDSQSGSTQHKTCGPCLAGSCHAPTGAQALGMDAVQVPGPSWLAGGSTAPRHAASGALVPAATMLGNRDHNTSQREAVRRQSTVSSARGSLALAGWALHQGQAAQRHQ